MTGLLKLAIQLAILLVSVISSRARPLDSVSSLLGGRSDWDLVLHIGLLGRHEATWDICEQLGSALTAGFGEFAGDISLPSTTEVNMTLLNGGWILFQQTEVNRMETSLSFVVDGSSSSALEGGEDVMKGTEFILHVAPFAGYEEDATMIRMGVRYLMSSKVSSAEEEHNINYVRHLIDTMADAFRIKQGAFPCSADFRSFSGTCNNPYDSDWGTVGTYLRRIPKPPGSSSTARDPSYADGSGDIPDVDGPNPRDISNIIFSQDRSIESKRGASAELVWWGQFIDHDLDFTPGSAGTMREERMDFPIRSEDPMSKAIGASKISFSRSLKATRGDSSERRSQVNMQTSFVDGSQVYGCERDRSHVLRAHEGGLLKEINSLLPSNSVEDIGLKIHNEASSDDEHFAAGDARANEQPLLTAHHTLFVREHNRIAAKLGRMTECLGDEQIFQYARKIVSAQIQYITYEFYLPALLGTNALTPYAGYDESVDPSIDNFFSTVAFRYGHSQVPNEIMVAALKRNSSNIRTREGKEDAREDIFQPLHEVFFDPSFVRENGIESILLGATRQIAQAVDTKVVDALRSRLFQKLTGGLDLVALNIQRGRDHGIPLYCDARELYGLPRPVSWSEITADKTVQKKLSEVYGSINNVDSYVGGVAEDTLPNSELGPLFHAAVKHQFTKLRDGDRFFYERLNFPADLEKMFEVQEIRQKTLKLQDIIVRNSVPGRKLASSDFRSNVFKITD